MRSPVQRVVGPESPGGSNCSMYLRYSLGLNCRGKKNWYLMADLRSYISIVAVSWTNY